jgi:hypothetical protein
VTDSRSEVVEFIFGGRNSGQRRNEEDTFPFCDAKNGKGSRGTAS